MTFRSHLDGSAHELSPERAIEIQTHARRRHHDVVRRVPALAGRARTRRGRRWSAPCAGRGAGSITDRAWRPRATPCRRLFGIVQGGTYAPLRERLRGGAHGRAVRRLFARRAVGRGARRHEPCAGGGRHGPSPGRQTPLSYGRRYAARPVAGGGARRGHVRLRPADPERPQGHGPHVAGPSRRQERGLRERPAAARSRLRLLRLPPVQPRLHPASLRGGRNPRHAARQPARGRLSRATHARGARRRSSRGATPSSRGGSRILYTSGDGLMPAARENA